MNLAEIRNGTRVFVDANIIIYAVQRVSAQCVDFLAACARGDVEGVLTTTVVAEVCHRRMIQEAQARGLVAANPARALAGRGALIGQLTVYADDVRDLLGGGLLVEPTLPEDFHLALEFQRRFGLLTIDSLNLAAARRLGIKAIATANGGFATVSGFLVHKPDDLSAG
jgi:predicted nucleic acid-binding protein